MRDTGSPHASANPRSPLARWTVLRFLSGWLPVVLWTAVIFLSSSQPQMPGPPGTLLDFVIKKAAHVVSYAVLAGLVWRAWGFRSETLFWSLLITALYGASDEWHQSMVPPRDAAVRDVAIDTMGGYLGLVILAAWKRR